MINGTAKRINRLLDELSVCDTFADIGCDHGYVAYGMLKAEKCRHVVISDISEKCLSKAKNLLKREFEGRFTAVVSNGFENLPEAIDEALIAGMGGELIVDILGKAGFLPERLVLQPMKNSDKVRRFLIGHGYRIVRDYTFKDGKFYDVISAEKGADAYSEEEFEFGRDNVKEKGKDFKEQVALKAEVLKSSLDKMGDGDRIVALEKINKKTELLK